MMFGLLSQVVGKDGDSVKETELRKRARYMKKMQGSIMAKMVK